jgi:hypothetical protein
LKLMEMAKWKASLNNQCPLDWFRTQIVTIGDKQLTIIWQICCVRRDGTFVFIFSELCLLYQNIIVFLNCKVSWKIMILLANLQKKQQMINI